ncbi:anhydro-N-acetylmuramic acid kinase [Caedibacter taeniospiralis]|uniref:anhydro-N-acetylmuramic acid kinase n=1 Tax=Caedibacter taeniospiralis TaxID=28907 RepID=UPI000C26F8B9|nr:anhydro-N-acetylmuramic acid kinase [Caedibacter taeniospiralis]
MSAQYYLGIMSGTSMDAIDCVVTGFDTTNFQLIAHSSFSYPGKIRDRINQIYQNNYSVSLNDLGDLDYTLGAVYAECVNKLLALHKLDKAQIKAIGCHGQTVYHHPEGEIKFSIQLGSGNVLSAQTGLPVINDFRNKDMIFGGQGAPLVPLFHQAFFAHESNPRVILNLGGIANISCLHPHKPLIGFDTGPANTLIDQWIKKHKHKPFDDSGSWGRGGVIQITVLDKMLADPYFAKEAPKSTGLEYFNLNWLNQFLSGDEKPQDIQATLHALTTQSIAQQLVKAQPDTKEIYVCGGGARNHFLLELLKTLLPNITIKPIKHLGIDEEWIEAVAFAWFAYCHINRIKIPFSMTTGSREDSVAGTWHFLTK